MAEFGASATLDVTIEDSSLREARRQIENDIGDVSVSVDAATGGPTSGPTPALADGGVGLGGLLEESNELQEDILEELEEMNPGGGGGGVGGMLGLGGGGGGGGGLGLLAPLLMGAKGAGIFAGAAAQGGMAADLFGGGSEGSDLLEGPGLFASLGLPALGASNMAAFDLLGDQFSGTGGDQQEFVDMLGGQDFLQGSPDERRQMAEDASFASPQMVQEQLFPDQDIFQDKTLTVPWEFADEPADGETIPRPSNEHPFMGQTFSETDTSARDEHPRMGSPTSLSGVSPDGGGSAGGDTNIDVTVNNEVRNSVDGQNIEREIDRKLDQAQQDILDQILRELDRALPFSL